MKRDTILYISDQTTSNNAVLAALNTTGYLVVSSNRSTQAVALLFVMHAAAVVVLDQRTREQTSFDLGRSLRAVRPDVPIILLCRKQAGCLPAWVDACFNAGEPLEKLTSIVRKMLNVGPSIHDGRFSHSLRRAG